MPNLELHPALLFPGPKQSPYTSGTVSSRLLHSLTVVLSSPETSRAVFLRVADLPDDVGITPRL